MKYTIITQKCGCHIFVEALLRSIHKYLQPDEIIVSDAKSLGHPKMRELSPQLHEEIMKARNEYILMLDQDIMIFDNSLIEEMFTHIVKPNVFVCGTYTHNYFVPGCPDLLVASCNMLNKQKYLEGVTFDKTSRTEPCVEPFSVAYKKGMELVKIDPGKRVFHLNSGFRWTYPDVTLGAYWKTVFENWKKKTGSEEIFEEYVIDDGMDYDDVCTVTMMIVFILENRWLSEVLSFSLLNITEKDLQYIDSYFNGTLDIETAALVQQLIEYIKDTTYLSHAHLYKGFTNNLFDYTELVDKYMKVYSHLGVQTTVDDTFKNRFCLPDQGYLLLTQGFKQLFYKVLKNKRVIYLGKSDDIADLNQRQDLQLLRYQYHQLDSLHDMNKFLATYIPAEWDIVLTNSEFYGNVVVGKVKKFGKLALNVGDAFSFTLNERTKHFLSVEEDRTGYTLIDSYPNYGKRLYEQYLL